jgi:hypothetical protein
MESEILLLPGTCLKVVDQLDLGNGLVAVQMHEIPSDAEVEEALFNEPEAIDFWKELSAERFEVPLEEFCEAVIKRMKLPLVKRLLGRREISAIQTESFQKYWSLWMFAGGDETTFSAYTKEEFVEPNKSDCFVSFQRFGMLLVWFGHFGKFLNELFNSTELKIFYDDTLSSVASANLLRRFVSSYERVSDLWLIRCSPKREYPFVVSFINPDKINGSGLPPVNHQRVTFNPDTRKYSFSNFENKKLYSHETITGLVEILKREYKLGRGVSNVKFEQINRPTNQHEDKYFV